MNLYGVRDLDRLPQLERLSPDERFGIRVVAQVLPFRTNDYVLDELIDWDTAPDDPMFRLTFYQPEMLSGHQFSRIANALRGGAVREEMREIVERTRSELNPHPSGQLTHVPHPLARHTSRAAVRQLVERIGDSQ